MIKFFIKYAHHIATSPLITDERKKLKTYGNIPVPISK
jgi:hypothetical protein